MERILVVGGMGFIGSHLVKNLIDEGHDVSVLDNFTQYFPAQDKNKMYSYNMNHRINVLTKGAQIVRGDTANKYDLRRKIEKLQPDRIVNFSALPLANMSIEYSEEAFSGIIQGNLNLLEILRDIRYVNRFVYISSSMVYGDFETIPMPEDGKKEPKEIYGGMKLAGEFLVKVYSQRYNIPYTIVRPSAVYGPTDNNWRVLGIFLSNAMEGKALNIRNGKKTCLDFSYVEDVAEGIKLASTLSAGENQTFNITRGEGISLQSLAESITSMIPDIVIKLSNDETFHPKRGALDISKARDLLGYNPKIGVVEGLKKYKDFLEGYFNEVADIRTVS